MTTMTSLRPRRSRNRGFSLLEVLIAILIFSFGVVGLAGLQAALIKSSSNADYRATATYLAAEARGLMWADVNNVGDYDTSANCADSAVCSAWMDKVSRLLPQGSGQIDIASTDATITIAWTPPGEETHTYVTVTSMNP